jgi:chemotaxis protein MotB
MKMKKIVIIALSVLLAAAIVLNIVSYRKYRDIETAFEKSEKKTVSLKEKIEKSDQQISVFEKQKRENAKKLEELGVSKARVSELGSMVSMKNQSLLEHQEKISKLESNFRAEKEITENLRSEISSKTTKIQKLEDRIQSADTQGVSLTEQLTRSRHETEGLRGQMSDISNQKSALEVALRQHKSVNKADVARLMKEVQNREAEMGELQGKLEKATSEALFLKGQLTSGQAEIEGLKGELSNLVKGKNVLGAELKQLKSTHSAIVAKLGEEIQDRDAMIEGLQGQVLDLTVLKIDFETKVAQQETFYGTTVARLMKEAQNREAEMGELQGKLERAKVQIAYHREQIEKERVEIAMLQQNLLETQKLRARLNENIDQMKSTYASIVNGLKGQIENREVIISKLEEKLSVTFVNRILFQSGKATVTPKGKEILTKVGQILRNVKLKKIRVEGHTDNKPILPEYQHKFPSNWELSAARAAAVIRYFQNELGFDPSNLEASGHSFYKPIETNETEEGRAQNRRVNIIIAPTFE